MNIRFEGGPGWKSGSASCPDERLLLEVELDDDPLLYLGRDENTGAIDGDWPPGSVGVSGASGICKFKSQAWTTLSAASTALLELSASLVNKYKIKSLRGGLALHYLDVAFEVSEHRSKLIVLMVGDGIKHSCIHDVQHANHSLHRRPQLV